MKNKFSLFLSFMLTVSVVYSQPVIIDSQIYSPQQLVTNVLIGGGIQVSNVVYTGSYAARGYFDATGSSFDTIMHTGIAMTNGSIINMGGPNNSSAITTNQNLPGDSDLSAMISPCITYDASVLEFDFIPQSDSIQLRYVFGSEEYPEYVFSNFIDVFGFFLTGPDPSGGNYLHHNIALIPGTITPVSINTVNASINSNYYISNGSGSTPNNEALQFDGYTKGIKAYAHVVPYSSYHIKLAVADAGDHVVDSGIFLQAGSFSSINQTPLVINPVINNCSCYNGNDGSVSLTVTGGLTPYSYLWSNGATIDSISGLTAGTYTVTVNSYFGPSVTQNVMITQPAQINVSISVTGNYLLNSAVTGGVPPYAYLWSTGATDDHIIVTNPAVITLTVTDSHSCTHTASIYETQPGTWSYICCTGNNHSIYIPANMVFVNGNPLASGSFIGVFYSLPSGGIACGGYKVWTGVSIALTAWGDDTMTPAKEGFSTNEAFLWKIWDISTSVEYIAYPEYVTNLPNQGFYAINGLSGLISLSDQTSQLTVTYISNDVSCYNGNNGSVSLSVTGGLTPYSYLWSTGATTSVITGLSGGVYNVTVSDNIGALLIDSVQITQPTALNSVVTVTGSYHLISSTTGGTPPYSYLWSNGATDENIITGIPGIYYLTVTDANSCSIIVSVSANMPLQITYTSVNVTCFGLSDGQIQLTATGGQTPYTWSWSTGAITSYLTGLPAGFYLVTVTDMSGSSETLGIQITQPAQLQAGIDLSGLDTLVATFTGGTLPVTYNWSNGETTNLIIASASGTYSVTITDSNGCSGVTEYILPENCNIIMSSNISGVTTIGGNDGIIDLTVTGDNPPFTFNWNNGATTEDLYGLPSGLYTVEIGQNDSLCQPVIYTFHLLEPNQNVPLDTLLTNPLDTCLNFTADSFYVTAVSVQGNVVFVTWVITGNGQTAIFPVTYTFGGYGTYMIVLEISCAKSSLTFTTYINITNHLEIENINTKDIQIYPNPFNGSFNLNLLGGTNTNIRIFNATGQMVFSTTVSDEYFSVNASKWPVGIYLVRVLFRNNMIITKTVIKQ